VNKVTCSNDHTVLSLACTNGHLDVVKFLLRSGADVTHRLKVTDLINLTLFIINIMRGCLGVSANKSEKNSKAFCCKRYIEVACLPQQCE